MGNDEELLPGITNFLKNQLIKDKLSESNEKTRVSILEMIEAKSAQGITKRYNDLHLVKSIPYVQSINDSNDDEREIGHIISLEEEYDLLPCLRNKKIANNPKVSVTRPQSNQYELVLNRDKEIDEETDNESTDEEHHSLEILREDKKRNSKSLLFPVINFKDRDNNKKSNLPPSSTTATTTTNQPGSNNNNNNGNNNNNNNGPNNGNTVRLTNLTGKVFSGELFKKGKINWKKVYAVLFQDGRLACCDNEKDLKLLKEIQLAKYDALIVTKDVKYKYEIRLSKPGYKTHILNVDTKEKADQWIKELNKLTNSLSDESKDDLGSITEKNECREKIAHDSNENISGESLDKITIQKTDPQQKKSKSKNTWLNKVKDFKTKVIADIFEYDKSPQGVLSVFCKELTETRWLPIHCNIKNRELVFHKQKQHSEDKKPDLILGLKGSQVSIAPNNEGSFTICLQQEETKVYMKFNGNEELNRWYQYLKRETTNTTNNGISSPTGSHSEPNLSSAANNTTEDNYACSDIYDEIPHDIDIENQNKILMRELPQLPVHPPPQTPDIALILANEETGYMDPLECRKPNSKVTKTKQVEYLEDNTYENSANRKSANLSKKDANTSHHGKNDASITGNKNEKLMKNLPKLSIEKPKNEEKITTKSQQQQEQLVNDDESPKYFDMSPKHLNNDTPAAKPKNVAAKNTSAVDRKKSPEIKNESSKKLLPKTNETGEKNRLRNSSYEKKKIFVDESNTPGKNLFVDLNTPGGNKLKTKLDEDNCIRRSDNNAEKSEDSNRKITGEAEVNNKNKSLIISNSKNVTNSANTEKNNYRKSNSSIIKNSRNSLLKLEAINTMNKIPTTSNASNSSEHISKSTGSTSINANNPIQLKSNEINNNPNLSKNNEPFAIENKNKKTTNIDLNSINSHGVDCMDGNTYLGGKKNPVKKDDAKKVLSRYNPLAIEQAKLEMKKSLNDKRNSLNLDGCKAALIAEKMKLFEGQKK